MEKSGRHGLITPRCAGTFAPVFRCPALLVVLFIAACACAQQRMVQDDGVTALLEDQRIGDTVVLLTAQRDGPANHRPSEPGARTQFPTPPPPLRLARCDTVPRTPPTPA